MIQRVINDVIASGVANKPCPSWPTGRLFSEMTTRDINDGYCRLFASRVVAAMPDTTARVEWGCDVRPDLDALDVCHAYIVLDGRYYDAECPDGEDDPAHLPCLQRSAARLFIRQLKEAKIRDAAR